MDLKKSQALRRNRTAFIVSLVVMLYAVLSILLAVISSGMNNGRLLRLIVCSVLILLNIAGYLKFKTNDMHYKRVCLNSFTIMYLVTLIGSDSMFVYAYIFPMIICTIIFMDMIYVTGCLIVSVIFNIGFFIKIGMATGFSPEMQAQGVEQMMIVLVVAFGAFMVSKQTIRFTKEDNQVILDKAEVQNKMAVEIIQLAEQLGGKFEEAKQLSGNLNSSMDSNHFAVSNIADSTLSTAQAIEQQTSMTYDIQKSIEAAGVSTNSMYDSSETTKSIVDESTQIIIELKEQAQTVQKVSDTTRDVTKQLNERIHDVDEIVSTIINISGQTNLLALNASIEAARAGEAGKGFAVVADQIRNLSEETKNASNQITEIISQLTSYAGEATKSMEMSVTAAERQNELIDTTDQKFEDIRTEVVQLYNNSTEMKQMVQHIVQANTNITDSISQLSAASEEVSATSNECLTISDTAVDALQQMNNLLDEIYAIAEQLRECADKEAES